MHIILIETPYQIQHFLRYITIVDLTYKTMEAGTKVWTEFLYDSFE